MKLIRKVVHWIFRLRDLEVKLEVMDTGSAISGNREIVYNLVIPKRDTNPIVNGDILFVEVGNTPEIYLAVEVNRIIIMNTGKMNSVNVRVQKV